MNFTQKLSPIFRVPGIVPKGFGHSNESECLLIKMYFKTLVITYVNTYILRLLFSFHVSSKLQQDERSEF